MLWQLRRPRKINKSSGCSCVEPLIDINKDIIGKVNDRQAIIYIGEYNTFAFIHGKVMPGGWVFSYRYIHQYLIYFEMEDSHWHDNCFYFHLHGLCKSIAYVDY